MNQNKQTDFSFGHNIHDSDPDIDRNIKQVPSWFESDNGFTIDSLVSEIQNRIKAVTQFVKEEGTLITYTKPDSQGKKTVNARNSTSGGIPKLKVENVSFDKRTAKILATRLYDGNFGKQVGVKIAFGGQTYIWYLTIDENNKNLSFLTNQFGANEEAWVGNEFLLYLENDEFSNRNGIHCAPKEATRARK